MTYRTLAERLVGATNDDRIRSVEAVAIAEALITTHFKARDAMMWQPIDTAPRDGTEILLSDGACVSIGGWLSRNDVGDECPFGTDPGWWAVACHNPTHWMPLPPPPALEEPKP